jgi:hypothetical protein
MAVCLSGQHLLDHDGLPVEDDSFYLALNAGPEAMSFRLPDGWLGGAWACVLDTAADRPFDSRAGVVWQASEAVRLASHSLLLARCTDQPVKRGGFG